MSRHAIIDPETKKVINVVIWEGKEWKPPRNTLVVHSSIADIDDEFDEPTMSFLKNTGRWYHKDTPNDDYRFGINPGRATREL